MSDESQRPRVPRTSEVEAANAALEAASDVLDRMPNVDPFVVQRLRQLADELLVSRTRHLNRIITWVPDDLKDLFSAISYGASRQGPATILRQLERFEEIAPVHELREDGLGYFLMWPDPRIEWIDQVRDPEQVGSYPGALGIYQEVFEAVKRRCRQYEHDRLSLPQIARLMREQVTYYARSLGAVDDLEEWLHAELPNLELERTIDRFPNVDFGDDLVHLVNARIDAEPELGKTDHLKRVRREVETWLAVMDAAWGDRRDPKKTVQEACAQFDEDPPPGWESHYLPGSGGMRVEASDEFMRQLGDLADQEESDEPDAASDD